MENPLVSSIAFNRNEAKLTVLGLPAGVGIAAKLIEPLAKAHIDIDMIIQSTVQSGSIDFTLTVHREEYQIALKLLKQFASETKAKEVIGDNKVAKISIIGVGMRSHSGVAERMFKTLADEGIDIYAIATSEIKISVIIDEKYLELAARALHTAFGLDKEIEEELNSVAVRE